MFTTNKTPTPPHPPFYTIIKELRDSYNLNWLRISMSYHRFLNLSQVFREDLNTKLAKGVVSEAYAKLPCNYNQSSKVNGECMYRGECIKSIVIYTA